MVDRTKLRRRVGPGLLVWILPLLVLTGCDSSTDSDEDFEAAYVLSVTGDLQVEVEGEAIHGVERILGTEEFVQTVTFIRSGSEVRLFQLLRRAETTRFDPGPGTLLEIDASWSPGTPGMVAGPWALRARMEDESGQVIELFSTSGEVELGGTQSSPVPGELSAVLVGVRESEEGEEEVVTVQVEATFNAIPAFLVN